MGAKKKKGGKGKGEGKNIGNHCCYLLTSLTSKFKDHTYIGYTVDPQRRIRQHNREIGQGAKQTGNKGPWRVVVFVSGFPNKACGLQFEWVWQNPLKSRRTTLLKETNPVSRGLQYRVPGKIRYLFEILQFSPWRRYPLTVNWVGDKNKSLETAIKKSPEFPPNISQKFLSALSDFGEEEGEEEIEGKIEWKGQGEQGGEGKEVEVGGVVEDEVEWGGVSLVQEKTEETDCVICHKTLISKRQTIACPHKHCKAPSHLICLSHLFLEQEEKRRREQNLPSVSHLIPDAGKCPSCYSQTTWGEVLAGKV